MKTKEEVLAMIDCMNGCYTAAYTADINNYNGSYTAYPVDALIDEDSEEYLGSEEWQMTEFYKAPANLDVDIWTQEFSEEHVNAFKNSLVNDDLYIASFVHGEKGLISLLIWE